MSPRRWSEAGAGGPDVELCTSVRDYDEALTPHATPGRTAVVMTMGALHAGHASLIRAARARVGDEGLVTVTVFVNPLQFGAGEDLDRYPRTLEADLELAAEAGADIVLAPPVRDVYPGGEPEVRVTAGPMGERYEGASRPGHFDGVLTVVAKLLHLTRPDVAFFGEKDAQQLAVIRRMVTDLNFPVRVVGVPTVREADGLALSSRNRYLAPAERTTALALSRALFAGRDALAAANGAPTPATADPAPGAPTTDTPAVDVAATDVTATDATTADGTTAAAPTAAAPATGAPAGIALTAAAPGSATAPLPDLVRRAARAVLAEAADHEPPLVLDYLALVDPADFTEVGDDFTGEAVLAVAARVGATRLIDNVRLEFAQRGARP
ncbi:pantoate--beta-alanine ligase [Streptomyces sp. 71268]|uniref:pantoate--beta-alanine ligase n=1 Tax=Streptomyces sp. 71268 TaxID=3002640 RepID=UPI0023F7B6E3|nr:pantoate--beta-alanine ligase [Streptomyces sp. 71268]WEV26927.1 pantoate--beta-alanine ligase [Streptomyces sp. 71268]